MNTGLGAITALPNTLFPGQNNGASPSFVGTASASSTPVNNAINRVGGDISSNAAAGNSGLAASAVIVKATGDPSSYTNQGDYGGVSHSLETTGSSSLELLLLTSQPPRHDRQVGRE